MNTTTKNESGNAKTTTWVFGDMLHPEDKKHVLNAYVYRMTFENIERHPRIAQYMWTNGYRLELIHDTEWLKKSRFAVRRDGRLDKRYRYINRG